jgi:hypothetical protein
MCVATANFRAAVGPLVWASSSLSRIWQDSPPGSAGQIDLYAAKDETYSFQIGIQSYLNLYNVTVSHSPLVGPGGAVISDPDISLFREQFIFVPALPSYLQGGSNPPRGAGMYADGLIPFVDPETGGTPVGGTIIGQPFTVSAGSNQVVWVDIHVPPKSPGGVYTGTFTVSSLSGSSTITLYLHVWNFNLPRVPHYKSSVQASPANQNAFMVRELLRNRQSPAWPLAPSVETSYVDQYGLSSSGIFMGTGWGFNNCHAAPPAPEPSAAQYQAAYAAHDPRLVVFNFLADQVDPDHGCTGVYPTLAQWSDYMHAAAPHLKTFLSVSPQPRVSSLYGHIDIWGCLPIDYQMYSSDIQARIAAGDEIWLYNAQVSDNFTPKQNLNWGSLDWRLSLGYISANLGFAGWQQWSVDCWGNSPWMDGTPSGCPGSSRDVPGDGFSMYPGGPVGLKGYAPSMRIKWSRDGINDWEYVYILTMLGQGAWAKSHIDPIAHDFATWTRDYTQVEQVRITLGNAIEQFSQKAVGTRPQRRGRPYDEGGSHIKARAAPPAR